MPFLTVDELNARLESPDNLVNKLKVHEIHRNGKPHGTIETPIEIKRTLGLLAGAGVKQKELVETFGVGGNRVSFFKNGMTKQGHVKHPDLAVVTETNQKNREDAEGKAISAVLQALDIIPEKLTPDRSLKSLTGAAKDLSVIAERMAGRSQAAIDNSKHIQLNLYSPRMKAVEDYEVIDV